MIQLMKESNYIWLISENQTKLLLFITINYPGAEPSRYGGRGWPGIQSDVMVNRDEALAPTLGRGREAANLDFEEERTDGKAVVAMP